jgi:hypothetical protein
MAKKKSNAGNAYILSQLNSYKGFSMPKVNVKAKPKADASKKKVEPKKKVENKKSGPSLYDTTVKDQYGKPVVNKPSDSKKKPYGMASKTSDKKKVVKKVETKKQTTPSKPKVTGNSFLDVATGARPADYYSVKTKPAAPTKKVAPVQKPKATVKKVETKKVVTKKPEVKKPAPINKDLLNKMTRTGQAFYLDTKTGKLEKNPDWNTEVGVKKLIKKTEDFKKGQSKKVKSKIESLKRPEIRKKVTIPEVVVTPPKKSEPTVSQLWQQKTGTSWSEAKKQGLTDGSASSNIALMKKLKSGEISKSSLSKPKTETTPTPVTTTPTPSPTPKPTPYAGSGIGAMERADMEFEEQGFRRGGSVKKMRKKIAVKRKK